MKQLMNNDRMRYLRFVNQVNNTLIKIGIKSVEYLGDMVKSDFGYKLKIRVYYVNGSVRTYEESLTINSGQFYTTKHVLSSQSNMTLDLSFSYAGDKDYDSLNILISANTNLMYANEPYTNRILLPLKLHHYVNPNILWDKFI